MPKIVRLKPYNRKEGFLLQRLTVRSRRMTQGRWYRVDDKFAAELALMHQPYPPGQTSTAPTPKAFDVAATKKDQLAIEKASKPKTPIEATSDLTTGDLKTTDLTKPGAAPKDKPSKRGAKPPRSSNR